jgi:hypothetical protein
MLFYFLFLELIIYPISLFYYSTYSGYVKIDDYVESSLEWSRCLFQYFYSVTDNSYLETCGWQPKSYLSVAGAQGPALAITFLSAIVIFLITLNKEVRGFWSQAFAPIIHYLGLESLLARIPWPNSNAVWTKLGFKPSSVLSTVSTSSYYEDSSVSVNPKEKKVGTAPSIAKKLMEISLGTMLPRKFQKNNSVLPSSSSDSYATVSIQGEQDSDSERQVFVAEIVPEDDDKVVTSTASEGRVVLDNV